MKTRLLLIAVCVGMLAQSGGAAAPLARRVPSGTLVYIGWAGTKSPAFQASMFSQLLKEPAFGQLVAALKKLANDNIRPEEERKLFQHAWSMGTLAIQRPIAVAWTGLQETRSEPIPTGAVLIDLGADRKAFEGHLDAVIAMVPERDRAKIRQATIGQVTYRTIQDRNDPEVSFGFAGNVFFVTLGPGMAADIIGLDADKSLAANKAFSARMKEVGGADEQVALYVDVTGIRKVVEPLIAAEMGAGNGPTPGQIFKAIGLGKVQAVASVTRIVDRGMSTRTKIFSRAPHHGLLMPLAGAALKDADLAHVPADADFACAANVSPAVLWQEIRTAVRSIQPKAETEMLQGLAQVEKALGLSLEKDLLDNMGDTWVISSAASQGGFLTGTVITVELKNARAFGVAVSKIEGFFEGMLKAQKAQAAQARFTCPMHPSIRTAAPGVCPICEKKLVEAPVRQRPSPSIETVKIGRNTIRYVALPVGPIPVAPAWTIHKDKLYIAAFPQVVQAAIENEGKDPLTASALFAACRAKVSKNASILSYVNTPKIIAQVYNLILVGWTLGANVGARESGLPMKPDWLPAMSKLGNYLPASISTVSSDRTGITFEQSGMLPFSGLMGGLGSAGPIMAAAVLVPRVAVTKHAIETKAAARDRQMEMEGKAAEQEGAAREPTRPRRAPQRRNGDF